MYSETVFMKRSEPGIMVSIYSSKWNGYKM